MWNEKARPAFWGGLGEAARHLDAAYRGFHAAGADAEKAAALALRRRALALESEAGGQR